MTVAVIVDSFPSVSETFVRGQVDFLCRAGHRVMVFAGSPPDPAATPYPGVEVVLYRTRTPNRLLRLFGAAGCLAVLGTRRPAAVPRLLDSRRWGREALSLNMLYQGAAFSRAAGADVLLAHFGPNGVVAARMKEAGVLKGRLFVFFHAYDLTSYVAARGREVYREVFARAERVFAVSERGREKLLALGCPPEICRVFRMGIDTTRFSCKPRLPVAGRPARLLSVGRLVPKKGFAVALAAVRQLREGGLDIRYDIIGDGPDRGVLQESITAAGLDRAVTLCGPLGAGAVAEAMAGADLFLLPSIMAPSGDEEGVPVVLMEALACGLPVVASDSGAVNEIILPGKTGTLVPPGDAAALAGSVRAFLAAPGQAAEMAGNGRVLVERMYNEQILGSELVDAFTASA